MTRAVSRLDGGVTVDGAMPTVPGFTVRNGDVIDMIVDKLLVVDDVAGPHSGGFGLVNLYAIDLHEEPQTPGTMINSPWGMVEVLAVDHARAIEAAACWRGAGNGLRHAEPPRPLRDEAGS